MREAEPHPQDIPRGSASGVLAGEAVAGGFPTREGDFPPLSSRESSRAFSSSSTCVAQSLLGDWLTDSTSHLPSPSSPLLARRSSVSSGISTRLSLPTSTCCFWASVGQEDNKHKAESAVVGTVRFSPVTEGAVLPPTVRSVSPVNIDAPSSCACGCCWLGTSVCG